MQAALCDLDGVVYQGEAPIEGAADAVCWFQEQNIPHLFVTKTTSRPRSDIIDKLRRFGMDTDEARILTPSVARLHWLRANVNGPVALFVPPRHPRRVCKSAHIA